MIQLTIPDIAMALGLMAIAIGLSAWQKLGLEWQLLIATVRTIVQLIFIGYVLSIVFATKQPWLVIGILAVMLTVASVVARNRISKKIPRLLPLVWGSILTSTVLSISYTNLLVIRPDSWYEPQYLIPLVGIVLGNAMNAAAIAGERLVSTINSSPVEIETFLSLGATPQQAVTKYRKDAVRAALIPTLNSMMVIGIVTLPGILTGQLLTGVNPLDAVAYQMLIMFLLAFANLVTSLLVTYSLCRQFFNQDAQLQRW
ncbi:MAG: iron export ABC transporter permease subunit FetB [Microcoleaceae cyanobacterium MO_207.B10]|nr:iron export ABC transporter permease subunit FetB [Microcoleaceae cyanobacterium MO_207.B10]